MILTVISKRGTSHLKIGITKCHDKHLTHFGRNKTDADVNHDLMRDMTPKFRVFKFSGSCPTLNVALGRQRFTQASCSSSPVSVIDERGHTVVVLQLPFEGTVSCRASPSSSSSLSESTRFGCSVIRPRI